MDNIQTDLMVIIGWCFLYLYLICILVISIYCLNQFYLFFRFRTHLFSVEINSNELPFITVQLPLFNEKYVVDRLIRNIVKLDYPIDKIEFQILDDSTDDTLLESKKLAKEYNSIGYNIEVINRIERVGFKAGALKNGLEKARGEYLVIFDADFMPNPDFIMKTLPYFSDPKIGVVQARWEHINQPENLLTEIQAMQLNVHFTIEQGGRCEADYLLQFNGTAGIWKKEAIVEAGGWHIDTLTEDLDLSYRAQLKGWKIKFLDRVTSPAELPMDIGGLKAQQFRWMKGGAETAKKLLSTVWHSDLKNSKKIQSTIHLLSSSMYLIIFWLGISTLPLLLWVDNFKFISNFTKLFYISLISTVTIYYYVNVILLDSNKNIIKNSIKFAWHLPFFLALTSGMSFQNSIAVLEGWSSKKTPFIRTPKKGENKFDLNYRMKAIPMTSIFEGIFFLVFTFAIYHSISIANYSFLAFHILLSIGYGIIFFLSIQSLKN